MKTKKKHMGMRFAVEPNDYLRERESEALVWLVEGKSAEEASVIMGTTVRTQKAHRQRAMVALGANNAPSLVAMAFYHKIMRCVFFVLIAAQLGMTITPERTTPVPRPPFVRVVRTRTRENYELAGIRA